MRYLRHKTALSAAFIAVLISGAANAATLKSDVTVYSNVVTAKDLFDDAGEHANEPLFIAPDIGSSGQISAHRVAREAHDIGLYDVRLNGIDTVTVRRPSHKVTSRDVKVELRDAVGKALNNGIDFEIVTTSIPQVIHTDPRAENSLTIDGLRLLENGKKFHATLEYQTYGGSTKLPVRGNVVEMATIVVLTRDIARDEVLLPADVENKRILKSRTRTDTIKSLTGLVGKALTRNLQAGASLREQDAIEPLLVRSNDPVAITYAIPGLLLTSQGRALDSGPKGAIISVRNLQSKRIIRGRITNKGEVVVDARKPLFAQSDSTDAQEVQ